MHRRELTGQRKKNDFLGAASSVGGGGSGLWLPELGGRLQWAAGCSVKVSGGLNCTEECCGGSCGLG